MRAPTVPATVDFNLLSVVGRFAELFAASVDLSRKIKLSDTQLQAMGTTRDAIVRDYLDRTE